MFLLSLIKPRGEHTNRKSMPWLSLRWVASNKRKHYTISLLPSSLLNHKKRYDHFRTPNFTASRLCRIYIFNPLIITNVHISDDGKYWKIAYLVCGCFAIPAWKNTVFYNDVFQWNFYMESNYDHLWRTILADNRPQCLLSINSIQLPSHSQPYIFFNKLSIYPVTKSHYLICQVTSFFLPYNLK